MADNSTIELLSVELWEEIFEYFSPMDLRYSFHRINRKIDLIIDRTVLYLNFGKQGTYNYFMRNILPAMNVDNVRSLKFRENNEIKHFFSNISLNSLAQLRLLSFGQMYCFNNNFLIFWNQLSSLKYLQSLEIIYWGNVGPSNCVNEKKFIIRSIFNNDCCPLLKSFIISTTGSHQGGYTLPSLMATTKTTNIQNLSLDTLTFDDLIKLLHAMQNVKSFRIDYELCYDDRSNVQHESMIIYRPLLTNCISLHMKLSDDIKFEHVEYLLKHASNLKKLFIWGWYHLLDAMKWEIILSTCCQKLIRFHLICTGPTFNHNFDQTCDDFEKICPTRRFWLERNVTISFDEDVSAHDYNSDVVVRFNIEKKV
ncbi:unnamed protein product [Rotaria magnacalcarata]|uniref:F-box domain-containing protein n=1 Tax=Rotaria magnacalcarata TaxID=392030 RepID=A0A819UJH6_9BILA|nr:unnamed protein product [Rotaria magnacalcarata]CAF1597150.1 unnamed protein product [Rotaria magnacalcarata]CAF2084279.1 unnamed protein product [Rotaria magnacalcarata]CAF2092942.1 unnamed protein product [Rotaria magnacalcarata]CAF2250606.1 unnamed protein product [Rotaria magnacalcarata]